MTNTEYCKHGVLIDKRVPKAWFCRICEPKLAEQTDKFYEAEDRLQNKKKEQAIIDELDRCWEKNR